MALSRSEAEQRLAERQTPQPSFNQLPEMLSVYDVANYLGEPPQVVIALIKRGHLAGGKYPNRRGYWISRSALYDHILDITQFEFDEECDIIGAPTVEQQEPSTDREAVPPEAGSAEVASDPETLTLPFTADTAADDIGRLAVAAVNDLKAERDELEQQVKEIRDREQSIVLAAKEMGGFSWSQLAGWFNTTKSNFVSLYDPKTIAGKRRYALEHQRYLRETAAELKEQQRLPGPDASERQAS